MTRGLDRRGDPSRAIVLGLFLLSGASGLVYEVVWSRMFVLVLGSTVYAVSTVLAVFMGGLALGSWLFGRYVDRPATNGLRLFGWLELGIGLYALILPALMRLSDGIYRAAWPHVSDSFPALMALRLALAGIILIAPCTLMGGTLPVLSRFLVRRLQRTGREIGTLYGINTFGAFLGCCVTGYVLLEHLGVHRAMLTAVALNFVVGITALLWARGAPAKAAAPAEEEVPPNVRHYRPSQVRLALLLYAVSGFAALALEVLWVRSLMYFISTNTYAFTAMLSAFLCGLGVGSLVMARFAGRIKNPLLALGLIELLVGISAWASIPLFGKLHGAFTSVTGLVAGQAPLLGRIVPGLFCSFFIMLVPTLLMGAAFPLASAIYVGARRKVGRGVGTLYALNTIGAIGGSVTAGFLLIPAVGVQRAILLCASLYMVIGLALCAASPRTAPRRVLASASMAVGVAALIFLNLGFHGRPAVLESRYFKEESPGRMHELVFSYEGPAASLEVLRNPVGTKLLNINGITTAVNNYMDMQVHRMLSHLPLLLHPNPRTVLIVGFGMGSTPWGCCQHDVDRVDVVELLRSEKQTAPIFEDVNHGVLNHPKLHFIVGDGRNSLLGTDESYDVISFNAIHPRYSAYLYTVDFYRLCRERMRPDGVICAWMTQNGMLGREFRMLCRSFVEVFPHSTLWYCNPEHFCLIGTLGPTRVDVDAWQRRVASEPVQRDLADSNLGDPLVLASRYLLGGAALARYVADAPLNTDDRPRIEFSQSSKVEERQIVERLVELRQSMAPLLVASDDAGWSRDRVDLHERASRMLMIGQIEHWYPKASAAIKSEIAYRRALLLCPENEDVRHNLAFSTDVKRRIERKLSAVPNHKGALTRLGLILMEEGRLDEAEEHLVRALKIDNRFVPAAEQLGLVYLFRGDFEESVAWLRGVLRVKKGDARVLYALGQALGRAGRHDEAIGCRSAALDSSPEVEQWFTLREQTVRMMQDRLPSAIARQMSP